MRHLRSTRQIFTGRMLMQPSTARTLWSSSRGAKWGVCRCIR